MTAMGGHAKRRLPRGVGARVCLVGLLALLASCEKKEAAAPADPAPAVTATAPGATPPPTPIAPPATDTSPGPQDVGGAAPDPAPDSPAGASGDGAATPPEIAAKAARPVPGRPLPRPSMSVGAPDMPPPPPPSTSAAPPPPADSDAGGSTLATAPAPAPPPTATAAAPPVKRDVSYNKPGELRFREAIQVKVVLRPPATAVSGSFRGLAGEVTTAPIEVREEATAVLEGPADRVKIVRRVGFPAWQSTTGGNPMWMWDVTATAPGKADLDLTVKTKAAGAAAETVVESYHDTIPVRMGWIDAAKWWIGQIDPIWKWLVGVAGALGAAFVWFRTQFGRKPKAAA